MPEQARQEEKRKTDASMQKIENALDAIIIPECRFDDLVLEDAVETIRQLGIKHDPRAIPEERKGVNLLIDERQIRRAQPKALAQRISMQLGPTPLGALLNALAEFAGVSYRMDPYAVTIVPSPEVDILFTRRYPTERNLGIEDNARAFFENEGIQFPKGTTAFYLPGSEELVVRHTSQALSKIDELLKHPTHPQRCYVIYRPRADTYTITNRQLSTQRFSPFSTYKLPLTIMALEDQHVRYPGQAKWYDPLEHPADPWWPISWTTQPHDLRSAFQHSVNWYFQDLAAALDRQRVINHLRTWGYGNGVIVGSPRRYWLSSALKISPMEQIQFLRLFQEEHLGISKETTEATKQVCLVEEREGRRLYAKTGTGELESGWIGWYVGWIELNAPGDATYFAILCLDHTIETVRESRSHVVSQVFDVIGWPSE